MSLLPKPDQTVTAGAPLSHFGAPIRHDVASLFHQHAETCTACAAARPCREGDAVVAKFLTTSAGYFSAYHAG